jgi:ABC-type antimicrobial peptide transport system permease subunit
VPGITDQESIDDWDPPFPFDYQRIRKPQDEDYWDAYRTTPKAFIAKSAGNRLWGSRFGQTTSFRIGIVDDQTLARVESQLRSAIQSNLETFGFHLLHVKRDGLQASRGTTPFNLLFLGFSMFIIAAAMMLVCLLFRLSLDARARELGLLMAVGLSRRRVTGVFLLEALLITLIGAIVGGIGGVGYAALMIAGLRTWWLDAVVTPFLSLHADPFSLVLGATLGIVVSLLTIRLTIAALRHFAVVALLSQRAEPEPASARGRRRWMRYGIAAVWLFALAAGISAVFLRGESQAGAFFACGAGVLIASLMQIATWLRGQSARRAPTARAFGLPGLVIQNIGRNPGRSTLTIGLMATACFLIIAISAFRLAPTDQGTGGFRLIGQTDVAVFDNLNDPARRREVMGSQASVLDGTTVLALRMQEGDDASCRNLYQVQRPRILGIPPAFIQHFERPGATTFAWAASAAETERGMANPWQLLQDSGAGSREAIPVVLDKNTAMYSLHLYGGVGEEFELDYGPSGRVRFRVVGLLANSVLQGSLMVGESQLLRRFPHISGYRYLCIVCPAEKQDEVRRALEELYGDQGLLTFDTRVVLADLLAVQNTYLSTFQSLGGLGLLLGTFGLAAVQLRSVFERRSELALLSAVGFGQQRLIRLVLGEHFALLLGGLLLGTLAALAAVLPHALTTEVRPPWQALLIVLAVILAVGGLTGYLAMRPVVRTPLLSALRGD